MQSPKKGSTSSSSTTTTAKNSPSPSPPPSPSSKRPPTDKPEVETVTPNTNEENPTEDSATPATPTGGDKGRKLSKQTLKIPKQVAKPASGSSSAGDEAPLESLVDVPVREVIRSGAGQGGPAPAAAVMVDAATGKTNRVVINVGDTSSRSMKIKLPLKRKSREACPTPKRITTTCRLCRQKFSSWKAVYEHVQTQHPAAQEEVHDQTPHDQGEGNSGGVIAGEKKSGEEGSSGAKGGREFDLNQPMEGVQLPEEQNEEKGTPGNDKKDGPRKKFRFDLNELPPENDDDEDGMTA